LITIRLARLLLFQPTLLARLWAGFLGLIYLASLSRLLLNWIQSSSPAQRQQAKWLLLSLSIPLLQLSSFFLPAQSRAMTILYLRPWLLASMPLLIAWTLFRTNLMPHYRSLVFQRMPAAGLVLDQQQRILALNPTAEQLFHVQSDHLEGQPLAQVFPVLKDATDTVIIDGETYSYEINPLSDRRGLVSGQLIRLWPRPSMVSVQQLYADLGLELDRLRYQSDDGSSYSWNDYLGDLIFKVTMVGHLSAEHVQAEIDIVNLKLAAVLEHYPDRQLHAIIDAGYSHGIDRSARERTIRQWIEWGQHPCFGRMATINSGGFVQVILEALGRLAPRLQISIHPSQEEALVYLSNSGNQWTGLSFYNGGSKSKKPCRWVTKD